MTAKQKAEELFYKFNSFNTYGLDKECCKKSALFLVDEIIKTNPQEGYYIDVEYISDSKVEYWQEVKTEIEKI